MKRETISVYPLSVFNAHISDFWIGTLSSVVEHYPFIECPHRPSYYMLIYIWKAVGELTIDNERILLDGPKVVCVRPNAVFSMRIVSQAAGYVVCFNDSFFSLRYNNNVLYRFQFLVQRTASVFRVSAEKAGTWDYFLNQVIDEFTAEMESSEDLLRSFLNILLHQLDRSFYRLSGKEEKSIKHAKMIRFEQLVEQYFVVHRNPSFYSEQLHITTNYLNKLCHEYCHTTSGNLIRARTIKEAQRLLHHTQLSVAEIAYEIGFESASYFNTFYKKETGVTPENFRKIKLSKHEKY
ncbi:AraC-type DNA-binding protein [Chitinophaga sp. YR627]|uniref:AraC family transcriptional regulator n=1 Tax=Chitinophaga sp. YR627 TaxID=1881041 RepID=UPI0008F447F6|nr:helix-turn-helix transcriptional regulator [Chitinophaga sp. YR627]SFO53824.1 AraC-type DNA-binding protein [Chitinophaga sp. YR627]